MTREWSVQQQLLTKILYENDPNTFEQIERLNEENFIGYDRAVYNFIISHYTNEGKLPSLAIVRKKVGGAKLPEYDDIEQQNTKWFVKEIIDDTINSKLDSLVEDIADRDSVPCEERLNAIRSTVMEIDCSGNLEEDSVSISDEKSRKKRLELMNKRIENKEDLGIMTGIPQIDFVTGGVKTGDLWTISGYVNIGKSFFLSLLGCNFLRQGYNVAMITREMTPEQLAIRIDALYNGVPYSDFKNGWSMSKDDIARMNEFYSTFKPPKEKADLHIEQSIGGVSQISSILASKNPDILLVDGPYLMTEDSKSPSGWERVNDVWVAMKNLALATGIPNINTMQLSENKADMSKTSFSKAIMQSVNSAWGLEQSDELKGYNQVEVKSMKQRDGINGCSFLMDWDFTKASFDTFGEKGMSGFKEWQVNRKARRIKKPEEHNENVLTLGDIPHKKKLIFKK